MAIYDGARLRPGFLGREIVVPRPRRERQDRDSYPAIDAPARKPLAQPRAGTVSRRRARATVRAGRRTGRLSLVLGGIVLAFLLAFFSLAQTVRVTATDYEVDRLLAQQAQLQASRQELLSSLNRLGRESAVRKRAIDSGLFPLAKTVVVRAR
jgi:hypothetical protein